MNDIDDDNHDRHFDPEQMLEETNELIWDNREMAQCMGIRAEQAAQEAPGSPLAIALAELSSRLDLSLHIADSLARKRTAEGHDALSVTAAQLWHLGQLNQRTDALMDLADELVRAAR